MYYQITRRISITVCEKSILFRRSTFKIFPESFKIHTRNIVSKKMETLGSNTTLTSINANNPIKSLIRFNNITKSQQDNRDYRGLHLENGLKVLLISDPTTDKSAAALNVDVGHMSDPDNIPGLAHFCEHMLFLGTEKYPNENDYSNYLSENGGSSNAATYADSTKFYFDIIPDKLEPALDRFANFFTCPLFTETATDREINAVNSEHEKNLALDIWRIRQVNKSLSNPNHPYNKFGTGNLKTLVEDPKSNNIDVRSELIKFHQKWYSSNIMSVAIFGKESLDELEEMVISKFSGIINKNVTSPKWTDHPYLSDQHATKTFIVPVKDSRSLTLTFPTPDLDQYYKSGPEQYLSHLIGHEGMGSILSELKAKGWCNNLMSGQSTSARGFGFFDVTVDLTKEGFEHVDDIIKLIFQYLNMIREYGPQKRIFEEYCMLSEMQFRFKDKENPLTLVTSVVHGLQLYPLEEVLSAPYLISEWRPDLIKELLHDFTPECTRVIIVGQKIEPICEKTEIWYGTKFHTEKIALDVLKSWTDSGLNDNLHLPEPNVFIPTDFNLIPIESDVLKNPIIIHDTPVIRVWFKQDTEFLKPKTIMNFDFSSPIVYSDPLNCNLTQLFVQLFRDQLNEYLYSAELAGLRFNVSNTSYGVSLSISGYSHKQKVLLQKVLDQMFTFEVDPKRFEILKEQYHRTISNFKAEPPYQHAVYYLALILTEFAWTKEELLDALKLVTVDRLESFIKEFLSRMHVECLIHGNVNKPKALELTNLIEQKLNLTNSVTLPLLSRQLLLKREIKLANGESYLFETENEFHKSSCVELYLQCGMQDDQSNVFIDLASHIFSEPCYTMLRTKEQLGYIVFCGTRKANGVQGLRIIVQSNKHPTFVEQRIDAFMESMESVLEKMPEDEFERYKQALAHQKLEKPKRLSTQFNKFLNEISLQQFHFDRSNVEVAFLRTLTKPQFIDYYKEYLKIGGSKRNALYIHVLSTAEGGAGSVGYINTDEIITDIKSEPHIDIKELSTFKSSKELYSLVQPYINIQPKGGKSKL